VSKRANKPAPFTRPKTHWPYSRHPCDFLEHLEDLYFWGFINVRPFRCIFSDPIWGMLNLDAKNARNEMRAAMRGGRKHSYFFKSSKPYYKSRGRPHPNMEMIRYRAALNRR
jgi:hypothetical protein